MLATLGGHLPAGLPASCVVLLGSRSAHVSRAGTPEDQNHRGERCHSRPDSATPQPALLM